MAPLRLLLRADPGGLAGFDGNAVLPGAQSRLRQLRGDLELAHVELLSPEAIGVVFAAVTTTRREAMDGIVADLRAVIGIGPGASELIPDQDKAVRAIGGESRACPFCGLDGGRHASHCPKTWR